MGVVTMKDLLEAGVHFGHQTKRWNPKMDKYIFTARNGIHIIDLQLTSQFIDEAYKALFEIVQEGGRVLFVGTKKQAQEPIKEAAERSGQFYVNQRWLGGTLTNFKTIKSSIKKLHELYKMEQDGTFDKFTKKEVAALRKDMARLEKFLGGIKNMRKVPEAMFIIDPKKERHAIAEARKLDIPVFGIVDTNCDPDDLDYIIPANDDALRSISLIVGTMANAVIEGANAQKQSDKDATEEKPVVKEEVKKVEKPVKKEEPKTEQPKTEEPKKEVKKVVVKVTSEPVKEEKVEAPKKAEASKDLTAELENQTVAKLRELAKEHDLSNYSKLRKAELIELIKTAL